MDQKGGLDLGSQLPGIRNHKPWDRDQHFLSDQGSGCTIFVGSRS